MSAAQVLRQAEALKSAASDASRGANEAWVSRQALQDIYQKLLVMDLEYALDKKVEQDLWNHAFKNQINTLQAQTKDKQNPKRTETQTSLNLFLETASGFYLQLLQQLCSAFKLDLSFRRKSASLGIMKEYGPVDRTMKLPTKTSCMYICQHCLVHLGDIARYRQQIDQAQTYYRHAAQLVPYNGQPYNQLAILEAAKGNKLATVFHYTQSIAVKHPFPVASTNLDKFYAKISKDTRVDLHGKLYMNELVTMFLQYHAYIRLSTDLQKAKSHMSRLAANLPVHITSMSFSAYQLLQMVAINLFALYHAKRKLKTTSSESHNGKEEGDKDDMHKDEQPSSDGRRCYDMPFELTVLFLDMMLQCTPKQELKAKEFHTLPAIKTIFDWLRLDHDLLSNPAFKNSNIWTNLSKLLNSLQFCDAARKNLPDELEKYSQVPLSEDRDLQCFLPLQAAYSNYDFRTTCIADSLTPEQETWLRCHRLIEHGLQICEEFPSLNLLNVQKLKSGRLQFTAPAPHIKVYTGPDSNDGTPDRKLVKQNVAIQAIMQNRIRKTSNDTESAEVARSGGEKNESARLSRSRDKLNEQPANPTTLDAGVMATATALDNAVHVSKAFPTPPLIAPPSGGMMKNTGVVLLPESHQNETNIWENTSPFTAPLPKHTMQQQQKTMQQLQQLQQQQRAQQAMKTDHAQSFALSSSPQHQHHHQQPPSLQNGSLPPQLQAAMLNMGGMPVQSFSSQLLMQQQQQLAAANQNRFSRPRPLSGGGFAPPPSQLPPPPVLPPGQAAFLGQNAPIQCPPHAVLFPPSSGPMGNYGGPPPSCDFDQGRPSVMKMSPQTNPMQSTPHGNMPRPAMPQQPYSNPYQQVIAPPGGITSQQIRSPVMGQSSLFPSAVVGQSHQATLRMQMAPPRQSLPQMLPQGVDIFSQMSPQHGGQRSVGGGRAGVPIVGSSSQPQLMRHHDDNAERERQMSVNMSSLRMQSDSDPLLTHPFPPSDFPVLSEGVPAPVSPTTGPVGSLFSMTSDPGFGTKLLQPNTYSLFSSESPWTVQINKPEAKSHSSSPFASSSSSLRTTPDPFSGDERQVGGNYSLSVYNYGEGSPVGGTVDNTWSTNPMAASPKSTGSESSTGGLLSSNIQSLWSSGPSPLEKLLEQQKQQRHGDPH